MKSAQLLLSQAARTQSGGRAELYTSSTNLFKLEFLPKYEQSACHRCHRTLPCQQLPVVSVQLVPMRSGGAFTDDGLACCRWSAGRITHWQLPLTTSCSALGTTPCSSWAAAQRNPQASTQPRQSRQAGWSPMLMAPACLSSRCHFKAVLKVSCNEA